MLIYFLIALSVLFLSRWFIKTKYILNPVTFVFLHETVLKSIIGYYISISYFQDVSIEFNDQVLLKVLIFTFFYCIGVVSFSNGWLYRYLTRIGKPSIFEYQSKLKSKKFSYLLYIAILVAIGLTSLVALMASSGAGTLWLTNPREAYGGYRQGVGVIWVVFVNSIAMAALIYIFYSKSYGLKKLPYVMIFCLILYFSGSKGSILGVLLCFLYSVSHNTNQIGRKMTVIVVILLILLFSIITVLQGSYSSIYDSFTYFDYFYTTTLYQENIDAIRRATGSAQFLSYFWTFVPRFLFDSKPFEYGPVVVSSYLFPGAAELGYTPAYLEWVLVDLQFGIIGVGAIGLLKGILLGSSYRAYLKNKNSLFLFSLTSALGFGVFNMPGYIELPIIYIVINIIILRQFLRIKMKW